jgi:hypothetical protein
MKVEDFLEAYHDHFLPNLSFSPVILQFYDNPVNKSLKCQQEIYFICLKIPGKILKHVAREDGEDRFYRLSEK